jgi:hypothetical protein
MDVRLKRAYEPAADSDDHWVLTFKRTEKTP